QRVPHAALLAELGDALLAFFKQLRQSGDARRTTVLVFSEFGRRVAENDSAGTDHGAAGPVLVVGGSVRGGLVGKSPNLEERDHGDLRVTPDFRGISATFLEHVLGVDSGNLPGGRFEPL